MKLKRKKSRIIFSVILPVIFVFSLLYFTLRIKKERKEVVAVVNGWKITYDDILTKLKSSPDFYIEYIKENPKQIVDDYINEIILFQIAKKYERKFRKEIKNRMKNYYIKTLTEEFVEKELTRKIKISEDEIKEYYNSHLQDFVIPEKVRLYEIVVDTKRKAENILKRLSLGESFEKIAERESISENRKNGGDIGWIEVEKLDPEIASLVVKMNPGEILANVIKTEMGYHIIKLAGKTEKRILTLAEATPSIISILKAQKKKNEVERLIKKMKEKSKIQLFPGRIENLKERLK